MELPRVTEILKYFTSYDKVPPKILEKACVRGTIVHGICAGLAKGAWIPDSMIDECYHGYIKSFRLWAEAQVEAFVIVEKRFAHDELGYTGQVDFVVKGKDGELYLVDLKTSSKEQKTYPLQMGAYDLLLKRNNILVKGAMLVYINRDGEFPDINLMLDVKREAEVFISALDCWKYLHTKKERKNGRKVELLSTE